MSINRDFKRGFLKYFVVIGFVLFFMATVAIADVGAVDSNELVAMNISVEDSPVPEGGRIEYLAFDNNKSIREGLRILQARFQKNIVPSSKVDGPLTISRLYDVSFEEALEAILGPSFKYEQEGNFIKVYTAEEYKQIKEDRSRMVYKTFMLSYISADEALKLVTPVLSGSGLVQSSTAAKRGVPTTETISANLEDGGDNLGTNDMLIIFDYPENIIKAEDVIGSIDVRPKQVLIEAAILSVVLTEDTQFGIDWQTLKGTIGDLDDITQDSSDYLSNIGTGVVDKAGGMTVGVAWGDIGVFIRAVEQISDLTILAKPKILAVNKQLGQVYIGQKIGYREGNVVTEGGVLQEGSVKFLDTGTKLSFRPYIGDDGYIRMDIHPKDSTGSLEEGIPNETAAELVTNIIVKDGQTIVIGGLFRDQITSVKTQIPLLGDIPLLGAVFRGTSDNIVRTEVMVLLTPHIIEEPSETEGDKRADDASRVGYGAEEQLQWINRSRIAGKYYEKASKYHFNGDSMFALKELEVALYLQPTNLEASRLKERIILEQNPDAEIPRVVIDEVERPDSEKWYRKYNENK
ncbi:MAG: type II secretion system protein GspD [Planctomycetota bacterium]|jgi:type II secretory pathway component GspD/PulD (secretin)